MQLNLRKARKLEAKISKYLEAKQLTLEVQVRIRGQLVDAVKVVDSGSQELAQQLDSVTKLNELRFAIRFAIANANQNTQINALMNQREMLKAKLTLLLKLLTSEKAMSQEELGDLLYSKSTAVDKGENLGYGESTVNVKVSVVNENLRKAISDTITSTVKGLEDIEDQLAQKNLGAKISLSEENVALLKAQALI